MRELRVLTIIATVIAFCVLAALAVVIAMVISPGAMGLGGTHKDWFVHVTAENLVEYSEHIVLAHYVDEAVHETENSRMDPPEVESFTDVYRKFQVVESLKGGYQPGDMIYVAWDAGYTTINPETGGPRFNPRWVAPLPKGEVYGLFLNPRRFRPPHPIDPKAEVWETPNGLEVALVDDQGRFSFQTDRFYPDALKDMGLKAVPGSGAPFELTTDNVERLAASGSDNSHQ